MATVHANLGAEIDDAAGNRLFSDPALTAC